MYAGSPVTKVLLFPRAYYYEGFDQWSHPVNRGRLAEALLLSEQVVLQTDGFTEVAALVEDLGVRLLEDLLTQNRLRFLLHPFFFGTVTTSAAAWDIISAVVQPFDEVMEGKVSLEQAIQDRLEKTHRGIPDLGPDLLDAIVRGTLRAPSGIPQAVREELARDLGDDRKASGYEEVLAEFLKRPFPIRQLFESKEEGGQPVIRVRGALEGPVPWDRIKEASHGLVFLLEAQQQLALSAGTRADFVMTSPFFERVLSVKLGSENLAQLSKATSVVGLRTALSVLKLPDIGYLVNRDLVPLEKAIAFSNSQHGKQIRSYLAEVGERESSDDVEKQFLKAFAENLLSESQWEKLLANKTLGFAVFAVAQSLTVLKPVAGLALSLAEFGARNLISGQWKPVPVIKKHLIGCVLTRDLERERDRKWHYPSLEKLSHQGFAVAVVRRLDEEQGPLGEVILAAREGRERFCVAVARDAQGEAYLRSAEQMLPSRDSPAGQLLRHLGSGKLISVDPGSQGGHRREVAFVVKSKHGTTRIVGEYEQFAHLLSQLPCLLEPDKTNKDLKTREL